MAAISVAQAKSQLSDFLRRTEYGGDRFVVQRHGKPVAAIVSTDDLRRLEAMEDAQDVADAKLALKEAKKAGTIPLEVVLKRHGLEYLLGKSSKAKATRSSRLRRR